MVRCVLNDGICEMSVFYFLPKYVNFAWLVFRHFLDTRKRDNMLIKTADKMRRLLSLLLLKYDYYLFIYIFYHASVNETCKVGRVTILRVKMTCPEYLMVIYCCRLVVSVLYIYCTYNIYTYACSVVIFDRLLALHHRLRQQRRIKN